MTLHLIKLCVGCDSVKDLEDWIREKQRERRKQGQPREHIHRTRMAPKRADELTDGGSLFWVIRGQVMCRQKLTGVRPYVDKAGIGRCELVLAPKVIPVEPRPYRAFQGWRYLDVEGCAARPRPRRAGRPEHARDAAPRTARPRPALISPKRLAAPPGACRTPPGCARNPSIQTTRRRRAATGEEFRMRRLPLAHAIGALTVAACAAFAATAAVAQETVKIGLILPMTGPFTTTGKQIDAGVRFYMQQNGATVAGKKIEVILRDDGGVADNGRRIAQELLVRDKVNILAGFGLTPIALAVAPLATETKTPMVVMAAATSIVTERSPYIVRTSFAQAQNVVVIADWEAKQGLKKAVSVVSDFAPGYDSETYFKERFIQGGGQVPLSLRVPLMNPDFSPFLQRARDASPDGMYVFIPAGQAATFMRQFRERGLDQSGITLFGAGDITDDDLLNGMGDSMLGIVTAYFYSAAHPSAKNKAFVDGVKKANNGMRANFFGVVRLRRHAPDLRGAEEDRRQDRRRQLHQRRQGHELGKPARADDDRSGNPRRHPQHLHAQGREGERRALEHRVRHRRGGQGSGEGREEIAATGARGIRPRCCRSAWSCRSGRRPEAGAGHRPTSSTCSRVSAWRASR